jgi:HK97 gp10 family phage protein
MIDVSQVTQFAARLNLPVIEEPWTDEWSRKVADDMRSFAPVLTGDLRDSIDETSDGVEVGVDYGVYVEYGTAHNAPQSFTVPAINRNIKPAAQDLGRLVVRQLT